MTGSDAPGDPDAWRDAGALIGAVLRDHKADQWVILRNSDHARVALAAAQLAASTLIYAAQMCGVTDPDEALNHAERGLAAALAFPG